MDIDWGIFGQLLYSVVLIIMGIYINRYFERKPKLIQYIGHMSDFLIREQNKVAVYTHSLILRNAGNKPAKEISIAHKILPEHYKIHPPVKYEIRELPDSVKEIYIPSLRSQEQITVSYLYTTPHQIEDIHLSIKYEDGFAKPISVIQVPQYPQWVYWIIWILALLGLVFLIYEIFELLGYFSTKLGLKQ